MSKANLCVQVSDETKLSTKMKAIERGATMGRVIEALATKHLSELTYAEIHQSPYLKAGCQRQKSSGVVGSFTQPA